MQLNGFSASELGSVLNPIDPLMLVLTADGTVVHRRASMSDRVPTDLNQASTLRSVLSARVCAAWLRVVRISVQEGCTVLTWAILDGVGYQLVCAPYASADETCHANLAMLAMLPDVAGRGGGALPQGVRTVTLLEHEWGALEELSRSQLDTLRHVTRGLTNSEIASRNNRSKRAVEWHIRFLNQQLQVNGRERLAIIGRAAGLCSISDADWALILRSRPARRPSTHLARVAACAEPTLWPM